METIGASLSAEASAATTSHYSSPTFNAAVATSWFIRTIGIASIVCAVLSGGWIGGAILAGVGIYILRSTEVSFHKPLGVTMIVGGILGALSPILGIISRALLSATILGQGIHVLQVFSNEGIDTVVWKESRRRARIGVVAAALSLVLLALILILGASRALVK